MRSLNQVFTYVTTVERYPRWHGRAISAWQCSESPLTRGSEWWATVRNFGWGGTRVLHFVVTECEPNRLVMSSTSSLPYDMASGYTLELIPGGTRVYCHRVIRLRGWWRIIGPIIRRIVWDDMLEEARCLGEELAKLPVG